MMKFIIATNNQGKLAEFDAILGRAGYTVSSLREVGAETAEVEENGASYAENAFIKAASCRQTGGFAVIADDSGIEVDALDGAPGLYSARYGGEGATDADRRKKLLAAIEGVPAEKRTARFICAICCILPDGRKIEVTGRCEGSIGRAEKGDNGFGYDSLFILDETGLTFGEMSEPEKAIFSHRARAIQALIVRLKEENITC